MTEQMADTALREKGLTALEQQLGPAQTLRFLAMVSREPFDYQKWRRKTFDGMSLGQVLSGAGTTQD